MGKEKKLRKITDAAAGVISWHDQMQIRFDLWLAALWRSIVSGAAGVVTFHDYLQARFDRLILICRYHLAKLIHENRKKLEGKKKSIMGHFAGVVLVAIAMVALFNHATGFEYSYNGKVLGYVKNQEDVLKILDLVSDELSKEYGSTIQIDKDNDIAFKSVVVVDKDIDDVDTVLKRLTYMSDMEAEACGIYIDGQFYAACENEKAAKSVLKKVQDQFLEKQDNVKYEKVGFKEDVELKKYNTKLAYISSEKKAVEAILSGGNKEERYIVQSGDTYYDICEKFDISYEDLKKNNPDIQEELLFPGDELIMEKAVSALTVISVEKSTFAEKVKYKTEYRDDDTMYEGDEKVIQKGVNGKRVVTARITRENGEIIEKEVLKTETIKKTVKKIVVRGTKPVPKTAPTGKLIIPVSGYTLSSEFGWRWGRLHEGIDLACATGTTIRAADGGTVVRAGWYSGYGLCIDIDHGGGKMTRYGHCSAVNVSVGEKVYQGQKIGEVGNTGNSYGSHCHFEVRINGSPVNPFDYL